VQDEAFSASIGCSGGEFVVEVVVFPELLDFWFADFAVGALGEGGFGEEDCGCVCVFLSFGFSVSLFLLACYCIIVLLDVDMNE